MGRERMESRKVIKGLKAQCENTGTDHKHDELCGMVEDLRSRLMKTQKEKIALLEEKLCGLCEEKHPEDDRHAEIEAEKCDLQHKHDKLCTTVEDLRARLMKTQKEKIALLEEKLCMLCEEKHPEDGRHEEIKKKCADLEHNHEGMCQIIEDLRARLMKTQKEKIVLLEEKLCMLCDEEHVEDNRHEEKPVAIAAPKDVVLEEKCCDLENCIHDKDQEICELKRCFEAGCHDSSGTNYKAELTCARKERGDAKRKIAKMEATLAQ